MKILALIAATFVLIGCDPVKPRGDAPKPESDFMRGISNYSHTDLGHSDLYFFERDGRKFVLSKGYQCVSLLELKP